MKTTPISTDVARTILGSLAKIERDQVASALHMRRVMCANQWSFEDGSIMNGPEIGRAEQRRAWRSTAIAMLQKARDTRTLIAVLRDDLNQHTTRTAA